MTSLRTDARRPNGRHTAAVAVIATLAGLFAAMVGGSGPDTQSAGAAGKPPAALSGR